MKQITEQQRKSLFKGCQQIADILVENGISLNVVIKNLEVRPSKDSIADIYRSICDAKYGKDSIRELNSNQIDDAWEELVKAVSETTGIFIPFPSKENTEEYFNSLDSIQ